MIEVSPLVILLAAIFTNNMLLSNFLGMCSYIVISSEVETSLSLGQAVTFVMTCTTLINYLIYYHILVPLELEYIRYIIFIAVIAAFVQFVEMIINRFFRPLYYSLGIFLPLITVNCAILGGSLFMIIREYSLVQSIFFGFGSGVGWTLAIVVMAGIRTKIKKAPISDELQGAGITFITTGIMALTFLGFSGMFSIQ